MVSSHVLGCFVMFVVCGPCRSVDWTPRILVWLVVWNMAFIFHNIWDNPSHWLIFFKMVKHVKTTNQWLFFEGDIHFANHCYHGVFWSEGLELHTPRVGKMGFQGISLTHHYSPIWSVMATLDEKKTNGCLIIGGCHLSIILLLFGWYFQN